MIFLKLVTKVTIYSNIPKKYQLKINNRRFS